MTTSEQTFDSLLRLDDPAWWLEDNEPLFARLRQEAPVFWHEPMQTWVFSKYEDIKWASQTPETFSNARGTFLGENMRRDRIAARRGDFGSHPNLVFSDPPVHTYLRGLVSKAFTPRFVAGLEPDIRAITTEALDAVDPDSVIDLVSTVSAPIPLWVIARLIGVPPEDRQTFKRWTDLSATATATKDVEKVAEISQQWIPEMVGYFRQSIIDHRESPRDDLVSRLLAVQAEEALADPSDDKPIDLTDDTIIDNLWVLLAAGNETTRNLISWSMKVLAERPEQRALLVNDPNMLETAIDELLRWVTPVRHFSRTVNHPTTVRDVDIAADDYVTFLYLAANRDEEVFDRADQFDVLRVADPSHLAFGWGEHRCLGSNLARLEAKTALREILTRYPNFEIAGEPQPIGNPVLNIMDSLPVRLNGRARNS